MAFVVVNVLYYNNSKMTKIIISVNIDLTFEQDYGRSECFPLDTLSTTRFSLFYVWIWIVFWVYLNFFGLFLSMLLVVVLLH